MHEFTDGCSAQYKSRNCMGDVDTCRFKLGYKVLTRNFYETSLTVKAAGGFFKKQGGLRGSPGKDKNSICK